MILFECLLKAALAAKEAETQIANDHQRMTVIQDSVTEEVITGQTESSRVNHRRNTLIILENLPQKTVEREAAVGHVATRPNRSDERLVKLVTIVLKWMDRLAFDSFLVELTKELGKQVGKALIALVWILIALFLFWLFPVIVHLMLN